MARVKRLRVHQEMEIKRYKSLNWIGIGFDYLTVELSRLNVTHIHIYIPTSK